MRVHPEGMPGHLVVLGLEYSVEYYDSMAEVIPNSQELVRGIHNPVERTIRLFVSPSRYETWETLYHELVHAVLGRIGYADTSADETFVELFTAVLLDTLTRNCLVKPEEINA